MTAFVVLYIFLMIFFVSSNKISTQNRRYQCVLSFLGLLALLGLHSPSVGNDMQTYIPRFQSCDKNFSLQPDYIHGFEIGFVNYMTLIKNFTNDEQFFIFVSAVIILLPIIMLFYYYSKKTSLSIIVYTSWYLYYFSFSGLRQALAISICAVATFFIFKKKPVQFVFFVLLASQFHTSALVFIVAYPLYLFKISNKAMLISSTIILLFLIVFKDVISLAADLLFGEGNRYSGHIKSAQFGGFTIAILYLLLSIFQVYLNYKRINKSPYLPYLLILMLFQFTGLYSQTIPRIGYYFIPLFALSIPEMMSQISKKNRAIIEFSFVAFFVTFFFLQASTHYLDVTPFKFYWE